MKKLIYSLVVMMMMISSCRKSDNPKIPALIRVPVPNLTKDPTAGQAISALSPAASAAFAGKFTVDLKFPNDTKPAKMDVVVRKNGDNTNVKLFQANVSAWPTIVPVSGTQLISMFGPILLGDNFDFGVDIYTQDGQKFEAFPVTGTAYGAGVAGEYGGVTTLVTFAAICPYDDAVYQGNFVVVQDDWQDTNPGDIIVFTRIDATHFSYKYPSVSNQLPIIVAVNPLSNSVSITKQVIGSIWNYGVPAYTIPTAYTEGLPNSVAPCDKKVSLSIQYGIGGIPGPVFPNGPYIFILKKQ